MLFKARLALKLGKTYRELVEGVPGMYPWEIALIWKPLELLDGEWGEWRDDLRAARVAAAASGARISDHLPSAWVPESEREAMEQDEYEATKRAIHDSADMSTG